MNTANGFICLYRQITQWEWYRNPNTFRVFLHILLMANFTDGRFEGKEVKRGQLITSLPNLAKQTSLSIQQVRTSLAHLKSTGEITDTATRHYRIITICKYNEYQIDNRQNNRQVTDNQQTANRQSTDNQQQYNNDNKEIKKERNNNPSLSRRETFKPPTADDVKDYCAEKGFYNFDAQKFIDYYSSIGWMVGKHKMKDWKATIRTWIRKDNERERQKRQQEYDLPY